MTSIWSGVMVAPPLFAGQAGPAHQVHRLREASAEALPAS
jgi:hypothetical protein